MSISGTETPFLRSPTALVTNTRAVLNGVTYSMANITSVRVIRIDPNATWPLLVLVIGLARWLSGAS